MGFSRQEYWSGLPFPPPGYLPDPGIESGSPTLQADSLPFEVGMEGYFLILASQQSSVTNINMPILQINKERPKESEQACEKR